jgi:hypothetical protein
VDCEKCARTNLNNYRSNAAAGAEAARPSPASYCACAPWALRSTPPQPVRAVARPGRAGRCPSRANPGRWVGDPAPTDTEMDNAGSVNTGHRGGRAAIRGRTAEQSGQPGLPRLAGNGRRTGGGHVWLRVRGLLGPGESLAHRVAPPTTVPSADCYAPGRVLCRLLSDRGQGGKTGRGPAEVQGPVGRRVIEPKGNSRRPGPGDVRTRAGLLHRHYAVRPVSTGTT